MLKPKTILKSLDITEDRYWINNMRDDWILEEPRFIRIAFFETPDSPKYYNGLAVQLYGDDMYGYFILLKTLEVSPEQSESCKEFSFAGASEWEWNGGEDLVGEQLEEAKTLYSNYLLTKINEKIYKLSKELDETEEEWKIGHIDSVSFDNIRYSIYNKAEKLWLNQNYEEGRFPEYFEDLAVPENLRDAFNDTFGDCYISL